MSSLQHVAIIMDGNRRWATTRGLDPVKGHEYAAKEVIEPIIDACGKKHIPFVTFWAFSTENWKRDEKEIAGLFNVFRFALGSLANRFIQKGAKLKILGDINRFPKDIAKKTLEIINRSQKNSTITVTFALNYGGRDEIIRAIKKIVSRKTTPDEITEEVISANLDTAGIPDPDLVIRTGGEKRLSGYLPWQSTYSELYFTNTPFPDFTPKEFDKALSSFNKRDRRFGGGKVK